MKTTSKGSKVDSLHELFVHELKDIYSAEKQLLTALPKMIKAATTSELKEAFEEHLEVTKAQVERLEQVFSLIDVTPQARKCEAMEGLIAESEDVIRETTSTVVRDAALIVTAQKVEHYEIAAYGSVRTFANTLGYSDAADLLQETLDEEAEADEKLTAIAESSINEEANNE